jgi:putative FmdB family regulatory protein
MQEILFSPLKWRGSRFFASEVGKLPLYPYRCTQCGHSFEKIQSFSAAPETECPKCKGQLERQLTAPSLQFKGAGWYVNDYSKSGGASASAPKAETPCGGGGSACASCPAANSTN